MGHKQRSYTSSAVLALLLMVVMAMPANAAHTGCGLNEPSAQDPAECDVHGETVPANGQNSAGWCAATSRPVGGNPDHYTLAESIQDSGTNSCVGYTPRHYPQ